MPPSTPTHGLLRAKQRLQLATEADVVKALEGAVAASAADVAKWRRGAGGGGGRYLSEVRISRGTPEDPEALVAWLLSDRTETGAPRRGPPALLTVFVCTYDYQLKIARRTLRLAEAPDAT